MSNKRITDLTELTTPTTDDVFPVVDIATNTTTKVQLGNLPTTTAVTTALATKQDTLVSGTNIKTVNSTSLLGSGNVAVQPTLVSGTNIKTLNNTSLLGSGNITLTANPSGVSGAIQFSNGSAFASDAANLFWDDTNKRLGVGTNAPTTALQINYSSSTLNGILVNQTGGTSNFSNIGFANGGTIRSTFGMNLNTGEVRWFNASGGYFATIYGGGSEAMRIDASRNVGIGTASASARTHIVGSGSTSATTSLLVQNSAGTQLLKIADDNGVVCGTVASLVNRARFGTYLQIKYDTPDIDIWQGGSGVGLRITNNGALLAEFNDASGGGAIIRHSLSVGSASFASASARLQVDSTTQGFLPPRMTTTQKNAIASPAAGLVLYDSTTNKLQCYNGSTWNDLF